MCLIIVSPSLSVSREWNPIRGELGVEKKAESEFYFSFVLRFHGRK